MSTTQRPYVERGAQQAQKAEQKPVDNSVIDLDREDRDMPYLLRKISLGGVVGAARVA